MITSTAALQISLPMSQRKRTKRYRLHVNMCLFDMHQDIRMPMEPLVHGLGRIAISFFPNILILGTEIVV